MDFILENTNPVDNNAELLQQENEKYEELANRIAALNDLITQLNADYESLEESISDFRSAVNNTLDDHEQLINDNTDSINSLSNNNTTTNLSATNASISNGTINRLKVNSFTDLPALSPVSIATANGSIDDLQSDSITTDELTADTATIDALQANNITTDTFDISEIETEELHADTAFIDAVQVNNGLAIGGLRIIPSTISLSGWTNGYLHKVDIKTDGMLMLKLNDSAIVLTPGSISSNYDKLYAAYQGNDGTWSLYFDTDLVCNGVAVGLDNFNYSSSLVLKSSVRRNADSYGQPNTEGLKVIVLNTLPSIGQRNVIYVILGDCAYYCDGQYFYEMASKKRS